MSDVMNPLEVPPIERPDWPRHAKGEYPILVAVQFDETGHVALDQAILLAATHGHAPLHVAHVVADTDVSGRGSALDRKEYALDDAQDKLRDWVNARLGENALPVQCHVRMGDVVETLFQLALDYDAEVIVVGTHGRKGIKRFAFGSIAQKLVAEARCPVLIASPRDYAGMSVTLIPDPPKPGD